MDAMQAIVGIMGNVLKKRRKRNVFLPEALSMKTRALTNRLLRPLLLAVVNIVMTITGETAI